MRNKPRGGRSGSPTKERIETPTIKCGCGGNIIIDTAVCHLPKGANKEVDPLRYQTLCLSCGEIGSAMLTEDQLKSFMDSEDELMEVLLVSGKI